MKTWQKVGIALGGAAVLGGWPKAEGFRGVPDRTARRSLHDPLATPRTLHTPDIDVLNDIRSAAARLFCAVHCTGRLGTGHSHAIILPGADSRRASSCLNVHKQRMPLQD